MSNTESKKQIEELFQKPEMTITKHLLKQMVKTRNGHSGMLGIW